MKIVVAGGSGFVGKKFIQELIQRQHDVVLLSRSSRVEVSGFKHCLWDGKSQSDWSAEIDGADAVINLCGAGIVEKRWSEERKKELVDSRIESTEAIVESISHAQTKPSVLVNASAVGFYGDIEEGDVTEENQPGLGFLPELCVEWEQAALEARDLGVRVVLPRIGIVLEKQGGALAKMIPPFQCFLGGPLGHGKQWFPWIHLDDLIRLILFSIENLEISGPMNASAPNPVTMKDFCIALGKSLNRPSWLPVPSFVLSMLMGEMSQVLLTGKKAVPAVALKHGFEFKYECVQPALNAIVRS